MKLVPVNKLLWLLGESVDARDYITGLPHDWPTQSEWHVKLLGSGMEAGNTMGVFKWEQGDWVVQVLPVAYGYQLQVFKKSEQEVVFDNLYRGKERMDALVGMVRWYIEKLKKQAAPTQEAVDPKDFIASVPDDYEFMDDTERELDQMGFSLDTALHPHVWTLHVGPLSIHAWKTPHVVTNTAYGDMITNPVWNLEVRRGEMLLNVEEYIEGQAWQIPDDVRQQIKTYRDEGLVESMDPKEFITQTPDLREYLLSEYSLCSDLGTKSSDSEFGYIIVFYLTASESTILGCIRSITQKAGFKIEDVAWTIDPAKLPYEPMPRRVRVIYRKLK